MPIPKGLKERLRLFVSGLCMGAADLVPGVSGGTMALVMGIYENFIRSLCTFNAGAFQNLIFGRWKTLFRELAWQYLSIVVLGMGIAIFSLAPLFHFLLNHADYRPDLFAFFMGLIIASSAYCWRKVQTKNLGIWLCFASGLFMAVIITTAPFFFNFNLNPAGDSFALTLLWMFFCGLLAVCAMLLPGISGSYMLTIFGAYPVIIESLATFTRIESLAILICMGMGILTGALFFSQVIRWFLNRYHDKTIASMVGFMLGALPAVWPFWDYHFAKGRLTANIPVLPNPSSGEFLMALGFFAIGIIIVFLVERTSTALRPSKRYDAGGI